jgi:SAM-dependent methyltransferase
MDDKDHTWLGDDAKSWAHGLRNGYAKAFVISALHQTGVFELLREHGPRTSEQLAAEAKLDHRFLDGILSYLAFTDRVLDKTGDRFALTERGREWLWADPLLVLAYAGVGAYSCLLYELVPSLRGERRYGRDFERNGELLAKGSHHAGRHLYPYIVSEMSKLGVRTVADLGCGSGDLLISLCDIDPQLRGIGIDIAPGAIAESNRRIRARGLADRIRTVVADLRTPEVYAKDIADVEAFNAMMVYHEFLRDGEDSVIEMFQRMQRAFPGRYFFLGEFDRVSDDEFHAMRHPERVPLAFYQYVTHPLSLQGLPMESARWLALFERAGIAVVNVTKSNSFRLNVYTLRF